MKSSPYAQAVPYIVADMEKDREESNTETPIMEDEEVIHVYPTSDGGILFTKKELPKKEKKDDSRPPQDEEKPPYFSYILATLLMFSMLFIPSAAASNALPTVTVTIIPRSQQVTYNGTLQLGRVLAPITLSQSTTTQTTGHGHTPAQKARGYLTFFNGSFSSQTVSAGSTFTGSGGERVQTDATVTIPANNPPVDGQATVTAHAVKPGAQGNIQAGDINTTISSDLLVKNTAAFHGGLDERYYQTVAQSDIDSAAAPLKTSLSTSMQAALQAQGREGESLQLLPCSPSVTPDHQAGAEAKQVTVTVSLTCSAIAYNAQEIHDQATKLLTAQALKQLGNGYSLLGDIKVTVSRATVAQHKTSSLTFSSSGTWAYAFTAQEQERIKTLIAGKGNREVLQLLQDTPGIQSVSIENLAGNEMLPADPRNIQIIVLAAS